MNKVIELTEDKLSDHIWDPKVIVVYSSGMCGMCKVLKPNGFNRCETDGADYNFEGLAIEGKITLSTSNSWTGNGYKKTNWHLLVKLNLNEDGIVVSSFCALVPIDECVSKWTVPTLDSNFSSLKFDNIDSDKIVIIKGKLEEKTRLLAPILL
jgi:hypothetical protein